MVRGSGRLLLSRSSRGNSHGISSHASDPRGGSTKINVDNSGWIIHGLPTSAGGICPKFDVYTYKGVNYLKVNSLAGCGPSTWDGYYLSCSRGGSVGLYSWSGACGWAIQGESLACQYNGYGLYLGGDYAYHAGPTSKLQPGFDTVYQTFPRNLNPELYAALGA